MSLPVFKLAAAAIVLGVVTGVGAVYMNMSGSGNGLNVADTGCERSSARLAAAKPLMSGQVAAVIPVSAPRKIEGLAFKGPDGQDLNLQSFKGKAVLMNLWATWCFPCRAEMPELDALQAEEGKDGGFEVVAVNIDTGDDSKPKAFLNDTGVQSLGYYRDNTLGVFNALKKEGLAIGLPVTLLIDNEGCLIGSMNGPAAWNSPDAKALVAAIRR